MNDKDNVQGTDIVSKIIVFFKQSLQLTFKYFWGKTLASLILGLIAFGWFKLIGIEHEGAMGIIIGISNLIPVIGGLVASIVCGIIAAFQSPISILWAVLSVLVLQQIDQWIITPLVVGNSVSLPPLLICLALIAGSWLWGAVGVIVAVPVAAIIKLFYTMFIRKESATPKQIDSGEQNTPKINESNQQDEKNNDKTE